MSSGCTGVMYIKSVIPTGGLAPYSVSLQSGQLPPGLFLQSNLILGIPTRTGTYPFYPEGDGQFESPAGLSVSTSIVIAAPLNITTTLVPQAVAGSFYSSQLAATPVNAAQTWTMLAGVLPSGVSLSPGGLLSGTAATERHYKLHSTFDGPVQPALPSGYAAADPYGGVTAHPRRSPRCPRPHRVRAFPHHSPHPAAPLPIRGRHPASFPPGSRFRAREYFQELQGLRAIMTSPRQRPMQGCRPSRNSSRLVLLWNPEVRATPGLSGQTAERASAATWRRASATA